MRLKETLAIERAPPRNWDSTHAPFSDTLKIKNDPSRRRQMSRLCACVMIFLLPAACLEFQEPTPNSAQGVNFPPLIDKKFVSPPPSAFLRKISIASGCRAIEFKVPPVRDFNKNDRLYYLWFLSGVLLPPYQGVIEPENRERAIITLKLDRQKIEDALGYSPLDVSFFENSHLLEFVVSDRPYAIPSSRYSDDGAAQEDSIYWSIWFSDSPCSQ